MSSSLSQSNSKSGIDHIGVGVGALIFDEAGKLLLTKRGQHAKNERGRWEIPGGAIEFGETFEQGLKREIREELGIEIELKDMLQLADHLIPDEQQHWVSPTYICEIVSGTPTILEPQKCDEIGWFSLEEAAKLPLSIVTQQDIAILNQRRSQQLIGSVIILENDQKQILLGKRKNAYKSGDYGLPGGRIHGEEKAVTAARRELTEETGVKAHELAFAGVVKEWQTTQTFIHFVYHCSHWSGIPATQEPEKCEAWEWFSSDALPHNIVAGHKTAIELFLRGNQLADI